MEQFNIGNVIEHYKLNTEDLARVLFPTVKYPKQAFVERLVVVLIDGRISFIGTAPGSS